MKRIKNEDRRFVAKVQRRRDKGLTWPEIAKELNLPQTTVYERFQRISMRCALEAANQQTAQNNGFYPNEAA